MYLRLHFVFWSNWGQPGFIQTKYYKYKFYSPHGTVTMVLDAWMKESLTKKWAIYFFFLIGMHWKSSVKVVPLSSVLL